MIDILLEGLDTETRMKLLPEEQRLVKVLESDGTIIENFIKLDMSGIYMVVMANDQDDVHTRLSILPYYPFMKIAITPIRVVNSVNH
jgi:muconolactone delta-isomerase